MNPPKQFAKEQDMVSMEVVCKKTVVEVSLQVPHPFGSDGDQLIFIDLSAVDCRRLALMLNEAAAYITNQKAT